MKLLAVLLLLLPAPALAWGEYGHRLVGKIAYDEASRTTRQAIRQLLKHRAELDTPTCKLTTLADAAVWPDCVRGLGDRFDFAVTWHYQNISVCQDFDIAAKCPDGNCVTTQITAQTAILADRSRTDAERLQALAFVAHFVGDVHQPLHVGDKGDRGGNDVFVDYPPTPGPRLKLHRIWDTEMAERSLQASPKVSRSLITQADRTTWRQGGVPDWARESWAASKATAYIGLGDFPDKCLVPVAAPVVDALGAVSGPRARIDDAYLAAAQPVIRARVEAAGVRLAALLDTALGTPR